MRIDLIRRQDVLHWLDGCDYELKDWQRWKLKTMVRDIPSAEKAQLSGEDATKDATSDLISRKKALDVIRTLQTYKLFEGDDMILVDKADVQTELMMLPSAQPEIIRCGQCKYAEAADSEDNQDGYTCQFHRGSIWFSGSYCSWAERREECTP